MIITHLNFAKGFRGGERQTCILIKKLSEKGYSQILVTRKKSVLKTMLKDVENLEFLEVSKPYILSLLKIKNAKILHAHETKAAQFCYFANLFCKIPYIITRRVDINVSNNFFNKRIYKNAKYCVCLSEAIKNRMLKFSREINVKIIPDCVSDFQIDKEKVKEIKDRFKNKFLIGTIGELTEEKGQEYLIETAKELSKDYSDIFFIILGRGEEEERYKLKAKDLNNIKFEGFVDNVGDYISSFDLFVFPSLNEGLGSSLLDVMKEKVPVIASEVGGIPDIIKNGENGLLIKPKNSKLIYEAILKLYTNKEFAYELGVNGFKSSLNYSSDIITKSYIEIYED